jgi:hypothetical protein
MQRSRKQAAAYTGWMTGHSIGSRLMDYLVDMVATVPDGTTDQAVAGAR